MSASTMKGQKRSRPMEDVATFDECFAPLAYHIFPDGYPLSIISSSINSEIQESMEKTWPMLPGRALVSEKEALASIKDLRIFGKRTGLTSHHQNLMIVAACATLESSADRGSRGIGYSKLCDGTSGIFQELLRSTLPRQFEPVSSFVVTKLLSTFRDPCFTIDREGKIGVLRFLTLAARNMALSPESLAALSSAYSILFSMSTDVDLCADIARLLHAITEIQHVRAYRANRLLKCLQLNEQFAPLQMLLHLYAQIDPEVCGPIYTQYRKLQSRHYAFPELSWEQSFLRTWHNHQEKVNNNSPQPAVPKRQRVSPVSLQSLSRYIDDAGSPDMDIIQNGCVLRAASMLNEVKISHIQLLCSNKYGSTIPPTTGSNLPQESARTQVCLQFLLQQEWYLAPTRSRKVNATRRNIVPERETQVYIQSDTNESNSENEKDELCHDLSRHGIHCRGESPGSTILLGNRSAMQPQQLSTKPHSKRHRARRGILQGISLLVTKTDEIPPEVESFLRDNILVSWDGTEEWGAILCFDILPNISIPGTFLELHNQVLGSLEKIFRHGEEKMQHDIVSGMLPKLLKRLLSRHQEPVVKGGNQHLAVRSSRKKLIKDFIYWVDELLNFGFLSKTACFSELLAAAGVDFFSDVCNGIVEQCNLLIMPSASLICRFFLASSPLTINRLCAMLLDYKTCLQALSKKQQDDETLGVAGASCEGLDQVTFFNSVIWDVCSMFWRCSPNIPSNVGSNETKTFFFNGVSDAMLEKLVQSSWKAKISASLSITNGAVFSEHAGAFLGRQRHNDELATAIGTDKAQGKLKQEYLDFLEECGMSGVHEFLSNFIGSLSKRAHRKRTPQC